MINTPLLPRDRILLRSHIELELMKQYEEVLNKNEQCFEYITRLFSKLDTEKTKTAIFNYPQIRKLLNDPTCTNCMSIVEKSA